VGASPGRRISATVFSLLTLAILGAAVFATSETGRAAVVEPPLAASGNVHLVAHIPGSAAGMNFTDHYAYVSGWGGITVLDIAKADDPKVVGSLPLPHFENEDVDLCGNTLIVANDREAQDLGSIPYVVSIANRTAPSVIAVLPLGLTGNGRGAGHIANFVKSDCSQLWVDGGNLVEVVDLSVPSAPRSLGKFESAASLSSSFKVTHDTELDSTGTAWSVGGGGAAGYRLTPDPLAPQLLGTTGTQDGIRRHTTTSSSTTPSGAERRCSSPKRTTSTPMRSRRAAAVDRGSSRPGTSRGSARVRSRRSTRGRPS
jgi:hypothetical protein